MIITSPPRNRTTTEMSSTPGLSALVSSLKNHESLTPTLHPRLVRNQLALTRCLALGVSGRHADPAGLDDILCATKSTLSEIYEQAFNFRAEITAVKQELDDVVTRALGTNVLKVPVSPPRLRKTPSSSSTTTMAADPAPAGVPPPRLRKTPAPKPLSSAESQSMLLEAQMLHLLARDPKRVVPPGKSIEAFLLGSKPEPKPASAAAGLEARISSTMKQSFWDEVGCKISRMEPC